MAAEISLFDGEGLPWIAAEVAKLSSGLAAYKKRKNRVRKI